MCNCEGISRTFMVGVWTLPGKVSYFGAGVGGTVIGFGASMLAMTDDLYKSLEDALSDTNNEKVWSWKQGTHDSRIEGNCCSIDIGTRWSATDVLGRMEEMGKYDEIIRIAALDENDRSFVRRYIRQSIITNCVRKRTIPFGVPSICKIQSRQSGCCSRNRSLTDLNWLILRASNRTVLSELPMWLTRRR